MMKTILIIGLLLLTACASRGEAVFVKQNMTLTNIVNIFMDEEASPAIEETLSNYEEELAIACGPLQRAGAKKMSMERVSFELKLQSFAVLDQCEEKTNEIEKYLKENNLYY